MIVPLKVIVEGLCAAYRRGSSLALFFDYDGTLTPIVARPSLAVLDGHTSRLLASLAARPRVSLAILSGRRLDELKTRFHLPGVYLAGSGGLELDLRGTRLEHPQAEQAAELADRVAARLAKDLVACPGAWLEQKRLGLAVHYRQLSVELALQLRGKIEEASRPFANEVRIVQGPSSWEVTPAWGWTKATAIRLILAHIGAPNPVPLYAGDGADDAEAMETVAAMSGTALWIGPHAPFAAQCQLADSGALRGFLADLDASLARWKSAPAASRQSPARLDLQRIALPIGHP